MKRLNNLYKETYDLDNIIDMTNKVCSKVRNKNKVNKFELYKSEHIINIKNRLQNKNIKLDKYNIFMITDPKCRIVMSQEIEDKIINHLVAEYILLKTFDNKYPSSMCATRIGKGTHYGIKLLKKYLNEMKNKYDNFYVLKIDISKYFYSIDHEILKKIISSKIKDKDALNILFNIIDSTDVPYINEKIIKLKEARINYLKSIKASEKLIKEVEEIPLYECGKGVPIGDQTSQAFGLIYLYELNHFIKEKLHIKYLINYMDDFVIIHHDKKYLKYCLDIIKNKLKNEYKLKLNNKKTKVDSIKGGIDFLGFNFYIRNKIIMKLRNNTKKKFKKRTKKLKLLKENDLISEKEYNMFVSSYKGHLSYGNCKSLFYKCLKE